MAQSSEEESFYPKLGIKRLQSTGVNNNVKEENKEESEEDNIEDFVKVVKPENETNNGKNNKEEKEIIIETPKPNNETNNNDGSKDSEIFEPGADDGFTDQQDNDYVMGEDVTKMGELDLEVVLQPEGDAKETNNDNNNNNNVDNNNNNNDKNNDNNKVPVEVDFIDSLPLKDQWNQLLKNKPGDYKPIITILKEKFPVNLISELSRISYGVIKSCPR